MANKYWWEEDEKQTDNKANSQSSSKAVKKYWWDDGTITKTFYDNVVNRTNSWIESGNAYLSNYQNRFSNRKFNNEDAYVSDSASWLDSFKTTGTGLQQEANDILNYVEQYKDFLDEDFVNDVKERLGSTSQQYGQLIDYATKDNEYWSQWETEDDYKSYLEGVKNRDALLSYDLNVGAKEIEGLRRSGDHYSTVSNLYTNYLNGLLEVYEPESTETPNEDYAAYEQYNPNAFEYEYDENGRLVDSAQNKYQIKGRYITKEGLDKLVAEYEILSKKYGNYGDLAATISEKERYHKQAERTQEGAKLASVSGNADFNNYNGYVRNTGNYVYDLVNNKGTGFEYIDKDEIAVFNYYVAKGDEASAEKYLDSIRETLNYRQAEAMAKDMEGNYLQEIFFQAKVGVDQFSSGMKGLWNAVTGNEEYVPASATQIAGGMAREDLGNMDLKWYNFKEGEWDDANIFGNSLGQVMADATSTTFNMLPSVLTSTAINFVAPGSGAVVGTTLLGASAGGNAYQEMINLGYSKGQARNYAVLVGGSEAILQYALGGISSLSGGGTKGVFQSIASKWLPHVDNAFARVAIKLGSNMLDEGLEEGIQEILTPWFKNLTLHTNEKVNWNDVAYSSLLGALTAGFMEGPSTIAGDVKTYKTGKKLQAADISAERLAKIGSTFSADTVAYQLAGKVNENTGAYTMGRLFNEIGATLTTQNVNEITTELMKRGMDAETAKANAEALAYVVEGGQLSDKQIAIIEANDVLAGVARDTLIDANTTWNQRAKGYNDALMSLANEMTSRKASKAKQAKQTQENAPVTDTVDTQKEVSTESLPEAETVDTSPAKVNNIADISKKTIKLEDGSEVNVKDADLSPDDGVRIETIASIDGISTEDANFVLNTLRTNTGASAQMDSLGAKEVYKYGFYGFSQDHIAKHGVFANSLTESQRQAIYEVGQKARQKQIDNASPKATTKQRGIYFDHGSGNVVAFKDADKSILSEKKRSAGVQAAVILNKLGIGGDIYFFESYRNSEGKLVYKDSNGKEKKAPNGRFSESDGSIHIDLNAGAKGEGLVLFTLAHELTHFIEKWSPKKYKILADFLIENYEKGQSMDKLVRAKQEYLKTVRKKDVSYDEAYSEVIADSMEAMLADGNVMEKIMELKAKDNDLVMKIKQFFDNLLAKIRNTYKGLTPDSAEGKAVLEMTDSIEKIQQLFAEALVEASDNFQTAQEQFSTDSIRGNADGAVVQSEVTTALVEATDGEILKSERTEYEALPKQVMSLSTGAGTLHNFIEGLTPTKLKGLAGKTTNGYTGRDVRAHAMGISGFSQEQIKAVNKFMDTMSEFMTEAGVTYKFIGLQDVKDAKLHYTYNADGSIKSIVLSAMVKNGDYPVNFDLSSICKKRVAMSKLIDKLATRGSLDSGTVKLTPANIFKINTALKNEGYETACLGCFVESKRYNSLEWAKTFCNKWNAAVKKVNPNATYFGYGDNTFTDDSFTLEQAVKVDEAATKYITTTKVERLANALKKYKAREQAGLPLVEKLSDAAKKRLVKSETISDELKDKYLNADVTTLTMADVEFLLENEVLPGASLSNKQAVTEMVKSGEAYQHLLRPSDLLTDRGISKLEALPNFHGVLYGHYGSGTPKLMQSYTPYNSEIALLPANKNSDQTLAEYLYTIAGVRMQSFSDFQIQNIYDYLQMVADLAARKLPAHAYTKEISFAKLLGMTGIKVNLSVMFDIDPMVDKAHAGLTKLNKLVHRGEYAKVVLEDAQGKWVYNIGDYQTQKLFAEAFPDEAKRFLQSIGFGDAVKLQSTPGYSSNCGIIGVGYSDLGIFAMLDDNRIRYIIPYHASSLPAEIKLATNIALGTDYTSYQNNMKIAGIVDKNGNAVNWSIKEAYKRLGSGQAVINELNEKVRTEGWVVTTKKAQTGHGTYGLYEDLQKTNDPRQTASNFMDWCIGNGTLPLFYQFASHENYYKLLYDFNVYDCVTEEYAPQQAVTNTYPTMVDGQVKPGNVTDGGFDVEYFQGTIDKQMAFMDEYSRNLDEDLDALVDNMEDGTLFSDRDYAEQVDEVKNNTHDPNNHVYMGSTPTGIANILELPKLPMLVTSQHIYSMAVSKAQAQRDGRYKSRFNYHNLGWDVVKKLPEYINKPVMIIKSNTDPNDATFVVVTAETDSAGSPIIAAVKPNGTGNYFNIEFPTNFMLSGYGKDGIQGYVATAKTENRILYASKKNSQKNKNTPSVQFADNILSSDYTANLAEFKKIVKSKFAGTIFENSGLPKFSDRDSEGNQLSKEQQGFFKDSKIRDANGNLLKVFHGTPKKFTTFRQGTAEGWGEGIYFTDNIEAAKEFGENIVEAYLNITNPFNIDTMSYYDIDFESTKAYQNFDKKYWQRWYDEYDTYEEYRDDGMGVDIDMIYTEYVDVFNKILRELGYDGIIAYQSNNIDGYEIVAFHENQPKLTSNTAPTISDDMRYQDRADESVSNRSLLANAFEGLAQNDIEKNKIQEYKGKIDLINSEEQKLSELNQKIKELSFAKGVRDTKKIRDLQFEARQTANRINTYDKQLLRLEASKPLQDVLAREKKKAYEKAEKRGKEALDKYKERAAKTQRELLERWQDSRKKGIENREKTAMKHKIQRVVGELNQLLLNGDKSHHVPENLKKAVADALALVNMDTVGAEERAAKYAALIAKETDPDKIDAYTVTMENILRQGEKMGQRLKELRDAYEEISESDDPDIANAYDPVIAGSLKELAQSIGNTSLRNMSIEQLQDVYDMYKMVLTRVRDANKSFLNDKKEAISSLASRVVGEVKRVGGEHKYRAAFLDFAKKFGWDNLKPVYAFEHLGSATLTDAFNNVRAGEDVWAVDVTEAREYYLDKSKKYGYDSWDFKKKHRFESASELEFELTLDQILSLYAYSKREQALDHLRLGGFVFDSNIETYKEEGSKLIKYKVNTADAHQITPEILANITGLLTEEQKAFVDEMQDYLSTVMGAKGNEVTMQMYGVKLFKEKFYFPLKSAKQFMFEQNEVSGEVKIKNSGFTNKVVAKANNPVILNNFMDVWAGHVNDMSMYHAFVLPLEDFNRIFNYNSPKQEGQPPVSVKGTIQNAYSPAAVNYVRQLITDLNGGAVSDPRETVAKAMMAKFKKAKVFTSLSVVIQQPSAIARAFALVNPKYFRPTKDGMNHKELWNELKQYAPVAVIKEMGYFDTNMGRSATDFIQGKKYSGIKEKSTALIKDSDYRDEILSKLPAWADEVTWCAIWNAVKRETVHTHKNLRPGSEEFLKAAGNRFTEVVTKTQVYDSVLARSANMRSKSGLMSMATSFMAEPTTTINMLEDALIQSRRGNKKYAAGEFASVMTAIVLNNVLNSLVYAERDDDEDETFIEKYMQSFVSGMLDDVNPITYYPFLKDMWSVLQGYDVERTDMSLFSELADSMKGIVKAYNTEGGDVTGAWLDIAGSVSNLAGIPMQNIRREWNGAVNFYKTLSKDFGGRATTWRSMGDALQASIRDTLPIIGWLPIETKADKLYDAIIKRDTAYVKRLKGSYKTEEAYNTAMRSAIKEHFESGDIDNDTAEEYLIEYGGMKKDDAYWRVQEWENEMETGEDFHKFDDFYTAVQTGKNLKTVIKEYTDNGVEAKTLASQITSYFKPLYKEMSNTERAAIKGYLLNAYQLLGYNRSEKSKDIDKWLKD